MSQTAVRILIMICLYYVMNCGSVPVGHRVQCDGEGYTFYYDHGTDNCELCREICQYAEIQGTMEQCGTNCPRYVRARRCEEKEGWYYNELLDSCQSCCELCDSIRDPSTQCMQKCSGFVTELRSNQAPSNLEEKAKGKHSLSLLPPCAHTNESSHPSTSDDQSAFVIVVIVAAVVLGIIVVLAGFGIIFMTPSKKANVPVLRPGDDCELNDNGVESGQPIEESKAARRDYVAVVHADGTVRSMTIVENTAFADLSMGHGHGSGLDPV